MEQLMKLCPLFESINLPELIQPGNVPMTPHNVMLATVGLCNDALPRGAIEAAIVELEERALYSRVQSKRAYFRDCIEQLRALLPEEQQ
jgi:hypothetical protein